MNYQNLTKEYENIQITLKKGMNVIVDLNSFFKSKIKYEEQVNYYTKISSEKLFNELLKSDHKSGINKQLFSFYINFEQYNTKHKSIMKRIESDIIDQTSIYEKHLNDGFKTTLDKFKTFLNNVNSRKNLLDQYKKKYFQSCSVLQEKQANFLKSKDELENYEEELKKDLNDFVQINNLNNKIVKAKQKMAQCHDLFIDSKMSIELNNHEYKYDLENFNEDLKKFEDSYNDIISELKRQEESRVYFIKCQLEKYYFFQSELNQCINEYTISMKELINSYEKNEEISCFNFSKTTVKEDNNEEIKTFRFKQEEYTQYDFNKNKNEELNSSSSSISSGIVSTLTSAFFNTFSYDKSDAKSENSSDKFSNEESLEEVIKYKLSIGEIPKDLPLEEEYSIIASFLSDYLIKSETINEKLKEYVLNAITIKKVDKRYQQISNDNINSSVNQNMINLSFVSVLDDRKKEPFSSLILSKKIIDALIQKLKKPYNVLNFDNKVNFELFSNIICQSLNNIKQFEDNHFDLYNAILYISNKSKFVITEKLTCKEEKTINTNCNLVQESFYLLPTINNNSDNFLNIGFFKKMIVHKLETKNLSSLGTIKEKYKESRDSKKSDNKTQKSNTLFSSINMIGSKMKNMIYSNNDSEKEIDKFDEKHNLLLILEKNKNLLSVLKEYIPIIVYSRISMQEIKKFIKEIYIKYYNIIDDVNERNSKIEYLNSFISLHFFSTKMYIKSQSKSYNEGFNEVSFK